MSSTSEGTARRTAVDKACELLWAVVERDMTGVGLTDLGRRLNLPKSTTFRLLKTLVRNNVLEQYGDHYRLGGLFAEALPTGPQVELIQIVLTGYLAKLYELTRCTVQLAVLDDADVVFLNKLHGIQRFPSPSRIGGRAPAHCTSIGKAMLAFDPVSTEKVCARGLDQWTARTNTDPDRLWAELARVRKTRIAIDDGEYVDAVASIAAPILVDNTPVASLCVTGAREDILAAGYEPILLRVCAEAQRAYLARLRPPQVRST
ncbi:IclR family transcriptional regulator [Granulicoccus phenolivorans]|uniref:IclR family transcriptional regulator n=1 Tax=Granulicoccus phenolivorans TaxID=266854 RepID=UPI0004117DA1|nr:IclR family transcriptional regulator [Granulicoccus phenolivorans]